MRCALRIAAFHCAALLPAQGEAPHAPEPQAGLGIREQLDAAVLAHAAPGFVGAVLVARGGRVILRTGYGNADRGATPATPKTLFDIASVSKQFTAAAILRLEADGRLTTRDTLDRFFDHLPADKAAIRLHDLLTHTGGLPTDLEFAAGELTDRDRWLARVWRAPRVGDPGEHFVYSNIGYGVLAAVVERAARRSFESFCKRALFEPAGLVDTGFVQDPDLDRSRAAARWQRSGDERHGETAIEWPWHWNFRGATGVVTTVDDLYAWDRALGGDAVLPRIQRDKLLRARFAGYAMGWEVADTRRGTVRQAHRGLTYGFESWCARYPDEDAFVCVLANHACRLGDLSDAIERLLFEAGAPADVLARAVGRWQTADGETLTVSARAGRIVVRGEGAELAARVRCGSARSARDRWSSAGFARHAERTVEDALRGRRKSAFSVDAAQAEVDRTQDAARRLRHAHGALRGVAALCGGGGTAESWLRVRFDRTDTLWRARWADDRTLLELTPTDATPPLPEVELDWREGGAFAGWSVDGRVPVALVVGDPPATATWRDDDSVRTPIVLRRAR